MSIQITGTNLINIEKERIENMRYLTSQGVKSNKNEVINLHFFFINFRHSKGCVKNTNCMYAVCL